MRAQNFNFLPKFLKNWGFKPQILDFKTQIFRQEIF